MNFQFLLSLLKSYHFNFVAMLSIKDQIAKFRSIVHTSGVIFLNVDFVLFNRVFYNIKV